MRISAVIPIISGSNGLERCLKTLEGWVYEVIIPFSGSRKINRKLINKYRLKILYCKNIEKGLEKKGIKESRADWVLVLKSGEEVSIPLKREILTNLHKVKKDCVSIPFIRNYKDLWEKVKQPERRLFRRYTWKVNDECETFVNPIRQYKEFVSPFKPIAGRHQIKKILVIKIRGIGDTVLMTPLLRAIKSYYRKASITCVVNPGSVDVLAGNPDVSRVIAYKGFMSVFYEILRSGSYDLSICPQASQRTAFLSLAARSPLKVINNHNGKNYFTSVRVRKPEEYEDAVERDLDCARSLGLKFKTKDVRIFLEKKERLNVRDFGFTVKDTLVGISVSASKKNKIWFKERYAELADRLIKDLGFKIIFFDDPSHPEELKQVVRLMKNKPYSVSEKKLRKVIQLISGLDVFIGNDSGLSHIAAGLFIPTVTIVGPDEPRIFHPYKEKEKHFVLSSEQNCKPCWKDTCDVPVCLDDISVAEVLAAVKKAV